MSFGRGRVGGRAFLNGRATPSVVAIVAGFNWMNERIEISFDFSMNERRFQRVKQMELFLGLGDK